MVRFVVLRHDCPDGTRHDDWMIERTDAAADPERPMLSFRIADWLEASDRFEAERIGDHRAAYLDYEGEISGGQGRVTRIERGEATIETLDADRIEIVLGGVRRLVGRSPDGRWWRFERA